MSKTIDCDLDGVLCSEEKTFNKSLATPNKKAISILNELYKHYKIVINTARGWQEYDMTKEQLKTWGVNYDILLCGKIIADYRIDDRSFISLEEFKEKTL